MATDAKIVAWITVNGKHIPLREGESKKDAISKAVAKDNEDIKEKQIAQRQKEADERNGKVSAKAVSTAEKNAKALGLDYDKVKKDTIAKYNKALSEYKKLGSKGDKMTGDEANKYKELGRYLKDKKKFVEENGDKPIKKKK